MKEIKYTDVRIGNQIFTCKLEKYDDDFFDTIVDIHVYKLHDHPRNLFEALKQFFKYPELASSTWIATLSDDTITDALNYACKSAAERENTRSELEKEWEKF